MARKRPTYSADVKAEAIRLYSGGLSANVVAKQLGLKHYTVKEWLTRAGVIRTMSEAAALAIANGAPRGFPRQHLAWTSSKTGETHYADSRYEIARMIQLDGDPEVADWTRCTDHLVYIGSNGRPKRYVPDFVVRFTSGTVCVEEVKPRFKLTDATVQAKTAAALAHYSSRGIGFRIVTEHELAATLANAVAIPARPYDADRARERRHARIGRETQAQAQKRRKKEADRAKARRRAMAVAPLANGLLSFGA